MNSRWIALTLAVTFASCLQAKAMTEEERFRQEQGAEARGNLQVGRGRDHHGGGWGYGDHHHGGNNGCYEVPGGRVQCPGDGGGYNPRPNYPPPPYYPPAPHYPPPNNYYYTQDIECSSNGYRYAECHFDGYRVFSVYLVNQRSNSSCDYNRSYGIGQDYVWVDQGCRAIFRIERR